MSFQYECLKPQEFMKTYNAEYADSKPQNLESFKAKVEQYLESLEAHKNQNEKGIVSNALMPFLQGLGFQAQVAYKHQANSEIDCALLKDSQVEVIIEAKKPENNKEMFSPNNPNCKALHECILYYLRERKGENQNLTRNASVRYILITDFYQFYIFNALAFKKCFEDNKEIQKLYKKLYEKGSLIENQNDFYKELSQILDSSAGGGGKSIPSRHKL
ncbi:hypothetical protein LS68_006770 [Helicobacter sp. MIT 05-5293]|uniref:DUF7149 domain-containing protein n=1 Tax=Helicobacter sp. MIT 05-5293 TaxID=1548149 RepID=UPI0010FCFDCA|nr:hypothetical protein [Helicobacter sp. MIT 05-5293]TLD80447.1 hypothetical protein LS68_006770 [Helicobacter sp. MIT 05-5293]